MNFYEMSNAMDKENWLELYWHTVDQHGSHIGKGPFEDPQYHGKLISLLRKTGMDQEANELEMVRISDEDFQYGKTPFPQSFSVGDLLKHKRDQDKKKSFRAAFNAYHRHLDDITEKVFQHITDMGWDQELDGEYEFRYPEGEADVYRRAKKLGYKIEAKFVKGDTSRSGWKHYVVKDPEGNTVASGKMEDVEDFFYRA